MSTMQQSGPQQAQGQVPWAPPPQFQPATGPQTPFQPMQGNPSSPSPGTGPKGPILPPQAPECAPFQSNYRIVVQIVVLLSMIHNIFTILLLLGGIVITAYFSLYPSTINGITYYNLVPAAICLAIFFSVVLLLVFAGLVTTTRSVWIATELQTPPSQGCGKFKWWSIISGMLIVEEAILTIAYVFSSDLKFFLPANFPVIAAFSITLRLASLFFTCGFQSELENATIQSPQHFGPPVVSNFTPRNYPKGPMLQPQGPTMRSSGGIVSTNSSLPLQSQQSTMN